MNNTVYNIADIQQIYPDWYKKDTDLSYGDQKFIWENTLLPEEDETKLRKLTINDSVGLNGIVNGSYKQQDNSEQNLSKHQAITRLRNCSHRTPSKEIAFYLEIIFGIWEKKPLHWPYIAQYYTPKTINSVVNQMIKAHQRGAVPLKVPGSYFTSIIKHKQPRKAFRATNGTYKQGDRYDNR